MNDNDTNPKDLVGRTKPNIHLVPPALVLHAAKAMEDGARKYEPYNWRKKKVSASVYVSAAYRHIMAYFDGEECAQDSGVHHLGHAAACLGIILDAAATGCLVDDRPTGGKTAELIKGLTQMPPQPKFPACPECGSTGNMHNFGCRTVRVVPRKPLAPETPTNDVCPSCRYLWPNHSSTCHLRP